MFSPAAGDGPDRSVTCDFFCDLSLSVNLFFLDRMVDKHTK